jgi:HAE1 family hydrophobic/amphiphilic exporter-1
MRAPMARAVIGGRVTSTLLTLVVVQVVYTYLDGLRPSAIGEWLRQRKRRRAATAAKPAPEAPGAIPASE